MAPQSITPRLSSEAVIDLLRDKRDQLRALSEIIAEIRESGSDVVRAWDQWERQIAIGNVRPEDWDGSADDIRDAPSADALLDEIADFLWTHFRCL